MLLWDTFFEAGEKELERERYQKAEKLLKSALGETSSFPEDDPRLLQTLLALVSVYQNSERPEEAEPHLAQAEELAKTSEKFKATLRARVVEARMTQSSFGADDPVSKAAHHKQMVEVWRQSGAEFEESLFQSLLKYAETLRDSSTEYEAREMLHEAQELAQKIYGQNSLERADVIAKLVDSFVLSELYSEAEGGARRQLAILSDLRGADDPGQAPVLAKLSEIVEAQRRTPEALELMERAASLAVGSDKFTYHLQLVEAHLREESSADALAKLITLEKNQIQGDLKFRYDLLLLRAYRGVKDSSALEEQAREMLDMQGSPGSNRLEAQLVLSELSPEDTETVSQALEEIAELDESEPVCDGELLARMADLAKVAGQRERSASFFDRAIEARTRILNPNDPQSVKVLFELGAIQERRRLLFDAATSWERSLELLKKHNGQVDEASEERRLRIELVQGLAGIYLRQQRWERAEQALRSIIRSSPPTSPQHARGRLGLTAVYAGQGEHQKAIEHLHSPDVKSFAEESVGREIFDGLFILEIENLVKLGRIPEAQRKCEQRQSRRQGDENCSVGELYAFSLVGSQTDPERFRSVGELLLAAKPGLAEEQLLLARFFVLLSEHNSRSFGSEADMFSVTSGEALERAIYWAIEANGEQDLNVAELYESSAQAAVARSDWEEGETATRKSLELFESLKGGQSKELVAPLQRLGELQLGRGQLDEAVESLKRCLDLASSQLRPQDPQTRELLRSLVEAHRRRGEFELSKEYLQQLLELHDSYKELGGESKLDDLLRGIRLLLGDEAEHRETLEQYLDEATVLAKNRGPVAELSLAFCYGQKARLVAQQDPDQAASLLEMQHQTLDSREEAREFIADQLYRARLLLFRGEPSQTLQLIKKLQEMQGGRFRKDDWVKEARILEARAYFQLRETELLGQQLDELMMMVGGADDESSGGSDRAEALCLKLNLRFHDPELVGEDEATNSYAELDALVENGDWSSYRARHQQREKRRWELARLAFESQRLSPEATQKRFQDQVSVLREERDVYPEPLGDALAHLGVLELHWGQYEEAFAHLDEARDLLQTSGDGESLSQARILGEIGAIAEKIGRLETGIDTLAQAISGFERHLGKEHPELVSLYLGLGRMNRSLKRLGNAEEALNKTKELLGVTGKELGLRLRSEVLREYAALQLDLGRARECRDTWVRLREDWEDAGELIPTTWMGDYSRALVNDGGFAEALQFFIDTLPLRLDQSEDEELMNLYADWLERTAELETADRVEASTEDLLEVRELFSNSVPEQEPEAPLELAWSRILVGFGRLHLAGLNPQVGAVEDVEEAISIRERLQGSESTSLGEVLSLRSELALLQGDLSAAEANLTRALNISESNTGPDTWEVAEILLQLASVYFRKRRFSPTEAVLQRTSELCKNLLSPDDERWIELCHLRGKLALELRRPAEAFETLQRALNLCKRHLRTPDSSLLMAAGRAALLTQEKELAFELLSRAEGHFDEDEPWNEDLEELKLALGELLIEREQFQEAERRLDKVLQLQEERFGYGDARLGRVFRALSRAACGLGELESAEEKLEIALALQDEELLSPLDLYSCYLDLTERLRERGDEERATGILKETLERLRPSNRPRKLAEVSRLLALSSEGRKDDEAAEAAWAQTVESLEESLNLLGSDSEAKPLYEKLIEPLTSLSRLMKLQGRYTAAEELTKSRLKYTELLDAPESQVSEVLFDLGELYRLQELYDEADELHTRVFESKAKELGLGHPDVGLSLRSLGQVSLGKGEFESASRFLKRAYSLQFDALGPEDPELAETLFARGDVEIAQGDFEASEDSYRQALEILQKNFGESSHQTARAWTSLAKLYEEKKQWSKAQPLLGKAMESMEAVLGPSHLDIADLLEQTGRVYLESGKLEEASEPLERAEKIRAEQLGETHPTTAEIIRLQGTYQSLLGDDQAARRLFSRADEKVSEHFGSEAPERFPYRFLLASSLLKTGELEQAQSHFEVLEAQLGDKDRAAQLRRADIWEQMARLRLVEEKFTEAESSAKSALDIRSRFLSTNSEEVAAAFEVLASIHKASDREITASALAERALDALEREAQVETRATVVMSRARLTLMLAQIELSHGSEKDAREQANSALNALREVLPESHPQVSEILHFLGEIELEAKRLEKAESYFERALKDWEAFFGGSHPKVCRAVNSLAKLYAQQGRLTLSEQYHQRNLVALEGRYGANSPVLVDTLLGLGRLCRSQGNADEAEDYLKRAAEIQKIQESNPKMATILHTLALVYQEQRNFIAAEALMKKARVLREELIDPKSPEIAESNLALARLYRASGKIEEAEPYLRTVLEWRTELWGEEHPEVASLLREMAELYADQEEYLKAQSLVKKALGIYGETLGQRNLELVGPLRQLARLLDLSGDNEEAEKQRRLAEELMGAS